MLIKTDIPKLTFLTPDYEGGESMSYINVGVSAGFPSHAQDFMEYKIDLNKALAKNQPATFYIRVSGHSMTDAGIDNGDILVVDRSLQPGSGKIAVCLIDGEFTVKRLKLADGCLYLMPENKEYKPIHVNEYSQFSVWGIVTYVIKEIG